MLVSLSLFQEFATGKEKELTDKDINEAVSYIFQYADDLETISKQMSEIKNNLRNSLNTQNTRAKTTIE